MIPPEVSAGDDSLTGYYTPRGKEKQAGAGLWLFPHAVLYYYKKSRSGGKGGPAMRTLTHIVTPEEEGRTVHSLSLIHI